MNSIATLNQFLMIISFSIALFAIIILFTGFYVIPQQQVYIIERFGKYLKSETTGLKFRIPFIDKIAYRLSLRIQELNINVETKTKDNIFINIRISVQFMVNQMKIYDATYKLTGVHNQVSSWDLNINKLL